MVKKNNPVYFCKSSKQQILKTLNYLKSDIQPDDNKKSHYTFIEMLCTDERFGIEVGWYITEDPKDSTFGRILDTAKHPFFKPGQERNTKVYRYLAQPIPPRAPKKDIAPIFDTMSKAIVNRNKPIGYRISKKALSVLKEHFKDHIVYKDDRGVASKSSRNPKWIRDELILALDLYFKRSPLHISQTHPDIIALSEILNKLPIHQLRPDEKEFRNPNSVYMKMCIFARFDASYKGKGLSSGRKLEKEVWDDFFNNKKELSKLAETLKAVAENNELREELSYVPVEKDEEGLSEGKIMMRLHKARERKPQLIMKKKEQVYKLTGKLVCEACKFDFALIYGKHGKGFIECHHKKPVADLKLKDKTRLEDLALVCSNCHRILHRGRWLLNIDELKAIIKGLQ